MYALMDVSTGVEQLAQQAARSLVLPPPAIRLNPSPPAAQLIHVPTWLWLDPSSWGSRTATASVPGMSVTATAVPVSVRWSTGDGGGVTCQGAGTPWTGGDPMAASPQEVTGILEGRAAELRQAAEGEVAESEWRAHQELT